MPENVYNTTIMFWLQNSLIFLLRWKRSLSFSPFVDHNEILMFAKFYRSDCILEYLNFQNFLGKHAPGPLVSYVFGTHYWHYHPDITHIPMTSCAPARKNSQRHPCFFGSCFTRQEKSTCNHKVRNNFLGVSIFRSIMIQPLIFLSS